MVVTSEALTLLTSTFYMPFSFVTYLFWKRTFCTNRSRRFYHIHTCKNAHILPVS